MQHQKPPVFGYRVFGRILLVAREGKGSFKSLGPPYAANFLPYIAAWHWPAF